MTSADRIAALRNPSPEQLREFAANPRLDWLPVFATAGALIADAIEIADSCARADIECHCLWVAGDDGIRWYDTRVTAPEETAAIAQAVRYLAARGMLRRHDEQPYLVTLEESA